MAKSPAERAARQRELRRQRKAKNEIIYIYGLMDPIDYHIRYVGKTDSPSLRLMQHLSESRCGYVNQDKCNWINSLVENNLMPIMNILEKTTKENASQREKWWIDEIIYRGNQIFNKIGVRTIIRASKNLKQRERLELKRLRKVESLVLKFIDASKKDDQGDIKPDWKTFHKIEELLNISIT